MKLNKIDYKIQLMYRGYGKEDFDNRTLKELKDLYDSGIKKHNCKVLDDNPTR